MHFIELLQSWELAMPKSTVDGTEILVPAGGKVRQACELVGKKIPCLFWHGGGAHWADLAVTWGGE
jgi:hypothetical protein